MATPPISASRLDRKIDVERRTASLDDYGEASEVWTAIAAAISASVTPVSGDERFVASQFVGKRVLEFRVRPAPFAGIEPPNVLDRIVYPTFYSEASPAIAPPENTVYDIKDVRELGRGKGWQIFAVSRSEAPIDAS